MNLCLQISVLAFRQQRDLQDLAVHHLLLHHLQREAEAVMSYSPLQHPKQKKIPLELQSRRLNGRLSPSSLVLRPFESTLTRPRWPLAVSCHCLFLLLEKVLEVEAVVVVLLLPS